MACRMRAAQELYDVRPILHDFPNEGPEHLADGLR
jgi:hypothetical protein